jgi:hypothetical protein
MRDEAWHSGYGFDYRWLDPHSTSSRYTENNTIGAVTVYVPKKPVTQDLLVFFPGSYTPCSEYDPLLSVAAEQVRTICLAYDNLVTIASLANGSEWSDTMPDAYYNARLAAFNGSIESEPGNNLQARLHAALKALETDQPGAWSPYILPDSPTPRWGAIRVAGHSQGAGAAAFISYMVEVSPFSHLPASRCPSPLLLAVHTHTHT